MSNFNAWMPLYIGDYLADTMHLTTMQHGAYLLLLMHAWKSDGYVPDTDEAQAAIVRLSVKDWRRCKAAVVSFFDEIGGRLYHARVGKELDIAAAVSEQRSKAGKASAAKRERERQQNGNGEPTPVEQPMECRAPPSPAPSFVVKPSSPASKIGRAEFLPDDWKPSDEDRSWAAKARPDLTPALLDEETERFKNHAKANARTAFDWSPNWRNWISKAKPAEPQKSPPGASTLPADRDGPDQWRARLKGYKPGKFWQTGDWGPRPESGQCRAPAPILAEWRQQVAQ